MHPKYFGKFFTVFTNDWCKICSFFSITKCVLISGNLHNYLKAHVWPSLQSWRQQLYHKMSQIKVAWNVLRVKTMNSGSSSDPLESKRRGEIVLHTSLYWARWSCEACIKTHSSISLPPQQCQFQAVVCVNTPKMYIQNGYFLQFSKNWKLS